jgi:hypothetical protein
MAFSIRAGHNFEAGVGECLNYAFRYLFGLIGLHPVVRIFLMKIKNRGRNYRVDLMRISQRCLRFPAEHSI